MPCGAELYGKTLQLRPARDLSSSGQFSILRRVSSSGAGRTELQRSTGRANADQVTGLIVRCLTESCPRPIKWSDRKLTWNLNSLLLRLGSTAGSLIRILDLQIRKPENTSTQDVCSKIDTRRQKQRLFIHLRCVK